MSVDAVVTNVAMGLKGFDKLISIDPCRLSIDGKLHEATQVGGLIRLRGPSVIEWAAELDRLLPDRYRITVQPVEID